MQPVEDVNRIMLILNTKSVLSTLFFHSLALKENNQLQKDITIKQAYLGEFEEFFLPF